MLNVCFYFVCIIYLLLVEKYDLFIVIIKTNLTNFNIYWKKISNNIDHIEMFGDNIIGDKYISWSKKTTSKLKQSIPVWDDFSKLCLLARVKPEFPHPLEATLTYSSLNQQARCRWVICRSSFKHKMGMSLRVMS